MFSKGTDFCEICFLGGKCYLVICFITQTETSVSTWIHDNNWRNVFSQVNMDFKNGNAFHKENTF